LRKLNSLGIADAEIFVSLLPAVPHKQNYHNGGGGVFYISASAFKEKVSGRSTVVISPEFSRITPIFP
jgi:hypothetical protein